MEESIYHILDIPLEIKKMQNEFPTVKQPCLKGEYTLSPKGQFEMKKSGRLVLAPPAPSEMPFPLKVNEDVYSDDELSSSYRDLYNILRFLRSKFKLAELDGIDIVCTREVLQLIMCTPYENKQDWAIAVCKYRNTIYMCQVKSPEIESSPFGPDDYKKQEEASRQKKLRQHCLFFTDKPDQPQPNTAWPQNEQPKESGQSYGVFCSSISGIKLLFDAPVISDHCPNGDKEMPKTFVDLQMRLDTMSRAEWSAHNLNDVLKWWVDCFLIGIENIHIAYHDNDFLVHRIKKSVVHELWKNCDKDWSANLCANFLVRFLGVIKERMANVNCPHTVYLFEHEAKVDKFTYRVNEERSEYSLIPDWFRDKLNDPRDILDPLTATLKI